MQQVITLVVDITLDLQWLLYPDLRHSKVSDGPPRAALNPDPPYIGLSIVYIEIVKGVSSRCDPP